MTNNDNGGKKNRFSAIRSLFPRTIVISVSDHGEFNVRIMPFYRLYDVLAQDELQHCRIEIKRNYSFAYSMKNEGYVEHGYKFFKKN